MKRQRFDSCHYLGWNNNKRHCGGTEDVMDQPPVETQHSLTGKRSREDYDDCMENVHSHKRVHTCPTTNEIAVQQQGKIVTIPESIVLGIWNHRNELMKHVAYLKSIIDKLQTYIRVNDVGGQRPFNTSIVCVKT